MQTGYKYFGGREVGKTHFSLYMYLFPLKSGLAENKVSWFNHSWQLSTTQPYTHSPPFLPWWDGKENHKKIQSRG